MRVELVATLTGHSDSVWCCSWSPDGRTLATCGTDKSIRLWTKPTPRTANSQKPSSQGGDNYGGVNELEVQQQLEQENQDQEKQNQDQEKQNQDQEKQNQEQLVSAPPSDTVKCGEGGGGGTEAGAGWRCAMILTDGHSRTIRRVAWSPCGRTLASCSFDGSVCVWRRRRRRCRRGDDDDDETDDGDFECTVTLEGHENEVKAVEFSPSGRYLATCSRDKTVWIWEQQQTQNANNRRTTTTSATDDNDDDDGDEFECVSVQSCHTQDVKCLRWHPKEDLLMSASYDNSINLYRDEGDDWTCEFTATGHDSTVWAVDFDRDGERFVSASDDRTLRVWKRYAAGNQIGVPPAWRVVSTIQGFHPRPIYAVSWCPLTGLIASGCGDNAVRVFAPDPDQLTSAAASSCEIEDAPVFTQAALVEAAHQRDVNSVAWNPKQAGLLATASDDETVKLWQVVDYEPLLV